MATRAQAWMTEPGQFYAIKKTGAVAYRRHGNGPWEQADTPGAPERAQLELVGHDKIDTGWFTVYRVRT